MIVRAAVLCLATMFALPAQVVQTAGACPPSGCPTSYHIVSAPIGGQFLILAQTAPNVSALHVKVFGLSNPAVPLLSCGCTVQPSTDFIDVQVGQFSGSFPCLTNFSSL